MESPESEIRLYRSGASAGLVEVARLHALAPPRAVEGDLRAPEIGDNYGDGDGDAAGPSLFVALVQEGLVVDFARLLFSGGEPSDAEGGPDCYSNASTSDDKGHNTASSGSTTGEEVDSDEALAALSLRGGGLLLDYEEEQWIDSSKWDGKGEEDCEGDAKGLVRGLTNSSRLAEDEGSSSQLEEALISKIPVKASSRLWRSWDDESSSGEEDLHLDQDKYDEEQKRACKAVQTRDDTKGGVEDFSTPSGQSSTSSNRSEKDEQNQEQVQTQKHDNESGQADLNSTELGQSSSSHEQDQIRIDLRLWPSQKHVLIKFWSGGKWVFTKDCALVWLNLQDMPESTLKVDFSAPFATISGFRNADCIMDFENNQLDDSSQLLHDVMTLLKPSIRNFQIVKRVGGAYACKAFKCLLMGNKCALKSLSQETPWTLEPREVEIISNLKDTNVMVFYQAWIEPWAYKGEAEQEYLFIHLEFCPSTLKHALLSENLHWFPDKWVLFEVIVRIVHKLHEASVVHRDLKPDNIFLNSDMVVRVGDFGDACIGADELGLYGRGMSNLGTRYYFAPELNSRGKVTEKVDIYSLGVVMFDIFSKFETESDRALIFPKLSKQGPHDSWDGDHNLYYMMTSLEASDRPSASEILEYIHLHHSG